MKKYSFIFKLIVLCILSVQGLAQAKKWVPIGSILEVQDRCEHLYFSWKENNQQLVYGIHSRALPEQGPEDKSGHAFSFDGPVDIEFIKEVKARKQSALKVLIPAMGSGRSVMDVLASHDQAHVFANDIRESAFSQLERLMRGYGRLHDMKRVTYLVGDIESKLESLDSGSIDLVYIANVFHFFSPEKVDGVLAQVKRVIKPDGKVFLSWRGEPSAGYTSIPDYRAGDCNGVIRDVLKQKKLQMSDPRYVVSSYFAKLRNANCIYPYYAAKNSDMEKHAKKNGFRVLSRGESSMIGCQLNFADGTKSPYLGEYKYRDVMGQAADPAYPNLNHLILEADRFEKNDF